jgi:hypothetical protein
MTSNFSHHPKEIRMSETPAPARRRTVITVIAVLVLIAAVIGGGIALNAALGSASTDAAYDALKDSGSDSAQAESGDSTDSALPPGFPILNSQRTDCDETEYDEFGEVCLITVLVDGPESADLIQAELEAAGYQIDYRDTFTDGEFGTGANQSGYTSDEHSVKVWVHYPEGEPHWIAEYTISNRG